MGSSNKVRSTNSDWRENLQWELSNYVLRFTPVQNGEYWAIYQSTNHPHNDGNYRVWGASGSNLVYQQIGLIADATISSLSQFTMEYITENTGRVKK